MTEVSEGINQSQSTNNSAPASYDSNTNASSSSNANVGESREERTFRQSEVTDIVNRVRKETIDRQHRLQNEQPDYYAQKYGEVKRTEPINAQNNQLDESYYRKIAGEEAQRLRDQWVQEARTKHEEELARNTVNSFTQKINAGREKYDDFDKVTGDIEYSAFPNTVQLLANYVDNSGDVLYSLGQDLTKMEMLESLAARSPQAAIKQIQRLAKSLAENESAKSMRIPNQPLSQLRPSNTGVDNGAMSVRDYRKKYRV